MNGLQIETIDRVRLLALDRPSVANAMDSRLHSAIVDALGEATKDASIRGVILASRYLKILSAGADLKEYADLERPAAMWRRAAMAPSAAFSLPEVKHGIPTPIGAALLARRGLITTRSTGCVDSRKSRHPRMP